MFSDPVLIMDQGKVQGGEGEEVAAVASPSKTDAAADRENVESPTSGKRQEAVASPAGK